MRSRYTTLGEPPSLLQQLGPLFGEVSAQGVADADGPPTLSVAPTRLHLFRGVHSALLTSINNCQTNHKIKKIKGKNIVKYKQKKKNDIL